MMSRFELESISEESEDDINDASYHTLLNDGIQRKGRISSKHYSSQQAWILVIRRSIFPLFLFCLLILFYLTNNSWSWNKNNSIKRYPFLLNNKFQLPMNKSGNGNNRYCPPFGCNERIHYPSIMVKPMKLAAELPILKNLTIKRIERLLTIANQSLLSEPNTVHHYCSIKHNWNKHYRESFAQRRRQIMRTCRKYNFDNKIFTKWHLATNRKIHSKHQSNGNENDHRNDHKFCNTKNCPILVNVQHQLLTCFVQKIASTSIKQLYSYLFHHKNSTNNNIINHGQQFLEPIKNLTAFHLKVNDQLYRISPAYLFRHKEYSHFYKTLFVRHPFVRIVSAFKDKAERNQTEEQYFYEKYWNPLLDRLHGKERDLNLKVTFKEFVEELLLKEDPYQYDEHWAPIWTRCEPCYLQYDFIGKLETGEEDFRRFKSKVNPELINMNIWENFNIQFGEQTAILLNNNEKLSQKELKIKLRCQKQRSKYIETIRYLLQLTPKTLIELYKRYYLDFELFGYNIEELFDAIK